MSVRLLLSQLNNHSRRLLNSVTVSAKEKGVARQVQCFRDRGEYVHIPMGLDLSFLPESAFAPLPTRTECHITPTKTLYSGKKQREEGVEEDKIKDQEEIVEEVLNFIPNGRGSCALYASTGVGKTSMAIHLSAMWKKKVCVICANSLVQDQWVEEYREAGAKVSYITNPARLDLDPTADVYVCGVQMASNLDPTMTSDIGTLIYDEAHLATETAITCSLLNFTPNTLLLMTGSPQREDGLEAGLELYSGKKEIVRILKKTFDSYKCLSKLVPNTSKKIRFAGKERTDYSAAMDSIHIQPGFYPMIVGLIRYIHRQALEGEKVLVFFRLNAVIEDVSARLSDIPHVLVNKNKKPDLSETSLILAIDKKMKEGVNVPGVKHILMTYSSKNVIQPEGRSRDDDFTFWQVIHQHKMFEDHWELTDKWFHIRSRGTHRTHVIDMTTLNNTAEASSSSAK